MIPQSGERLERAFKRHQLRQLAVAPPWETQDGDLVIEPGAAFGTGEHPTTLNCLEAIAVWSEEQSWLSSFGQKIAWMWGAGRVFGFGNCQMGFDARDWRRARCC